MSAPVHLPLLTPFAATVHVVLVAAVAVVVGLIAGGAGAFLVGRRLRRRDAANWVGPALVTLAVVFVAVAATLWLRFSDYTALAIDGRTVELHYPTWPRPAARLAIDQIETAQIEGASQTGGRRRARTLVLTVKPTSGLASGRWESAAGDPDYMLRALEWLEHASGGRLRRVERPPR